VRSMKKSKILSRLILVTLLTIILAISGVFSAFGAGDPVYGDETNPAQAAITKRLLMPEGTHTPTASFTFVIAKKDYNGDTSTDALALMPAITSKTASFTQANLGTIASGIKDVRVETTSLFSGITFPNAGVYTYTITETANTYAIADATKESMAYSTGSYDVAVYVRDGVSGTYIYAIAATITVKDTDDQTVGDKVDPTPGDPAVEGDYSDMIFTNTYIRSHGGTNPEDPTHQALSISKVVAGDFANRQLPFTFSVTVTQPALVTGTATYKAYVVDQTNTVVTSAFNGTGMLTDTMGGYFPFTSGTARTINLKHNQKLVFIDTHVGTTYVASEAAIADYTASVSIVVDGGAPVVVSNPLPNTALSTSTRILGASMNSAAFTNTYKEVTPTGLDISNLPFVVLLLVSTGGLVALIAGKRRRGDEVVYH